MLGRCMQRHRHQEFIRFLNAIEAVVPDGRMVHVILDNYATHQHPEGAGLARPPPALRLPLHPDRMLLAQCGRDLLRRAARRRLRRGVFRSIVDLQAAIDRYIAEHNAGAETLRLDRRSRRSRRRPRSKAQCATIRRSIRGSLRSQAGSCGHEPTCRLGAMRRK